VAFLPPCLYYNHHLRRSIFHITSSPTFGVDIHGCITSNLQNDPTVINNQDKDSVEFLILQYEKFTKLVQDLNNSPGLGSDAKTFYYKAQIILSDIENYQVSTQLKPIKQILIDGIKYWSDGAACFSNSSICGSDSEAIILLSKGKSKLDEFYSTIENYR
jgi:hypothetical protein